MREAIGLSLSEITVYLHSIVNHRKHKSLALDGDFQFIQLQNYRVFNKVWNTNLLPKLTLLWTFTYIRESTTPSLIDAYLMLSVVIHLTNKQSMLVFLKAPYLAQRFFFYTLVNWQDLQHQKSCEIQNFQDSGAFSFRQKTNEWNSHSYLLIKVI